MFPSRSRLVLWLWAATLLLSVLSVDARYAAPIVASANYGWARTTTTTRTTTTGANPNFVTTTTGTSYVSRTPLQARNVRTSGIVQKTLREYYKEKKQELIEEYALEVAEELFNNLFPSVNFTSVRALSESAVAATAATTIIFPVCTSLGLGILSPSFADVSTCTSYSTYDVMSSRMPTQAQKARLCSGSCLTLLDRLVETPIPFCAVQFDGEIVDLLSALFDKFSQCTAIPVETASVPTPAPVRNTPSKTTTTTTTTPETVAPTMTTESQPPTTESPTPTTTAPSQAATTAPTVRVSGASGTWTLWTSAALATTWAAVGLVLA